MNLEAKVNQSIVTAMKAKDTVALEALRAVKSAVLLAKTETAGKDGLSEAEEMQLLQRLVKQRKESAQIYSEQGREDLAAPELAQVSIIEKFLPAPMSEEEVAAMVDALIAETGATSMADMGKVMGMASAKSAGRADGKTISEIVKKKLSAT